MPQASGSRGGAGRQRAGRGCQRAHVQRVAGGKGVLTLARERDAAGVSDDRSTIGAGLAESSFKPCGSSDEATVTKRGCRRAAAVRRGHASRANRRWPKSGGPFRRRPRSERERSPRSGLGIACNGTRDRDIGPGRPDGEWKIGPAAKATTRMIGALRMFQKIRKSRYVSNAPAATGFIQLAFPECEGSPFGSIRGRHSLRQEDRAEPALWLRRCRESSLNGLGDGYKRTTGYNARKGAVRKRTFAPRRWAKLPGRNAIRQADSLIKRRRRRRRRSLRASDANARRRAGRLPECGATGD